MAPVGRLGLRARGRWHWLGRGIALDDQLSAGQRRKVVGRRGIDADLRLDRSRRLIEADLGQPIETPYWAG